MLLLLKMHLCWQGSTVAIRVVADLPLFAALHTLKKWCLLFTFSHLIFINSKYQTINMVCTPYLIYTVFLFSFAIYEVVKVVHVMTDLMIVV